MRDICFAKKGVSISESDVVAFETKVGRKLPADYRAFLLQFNGGTNPKYSVFSFERDGRTSSSQIKEIYSLHSGSYFQLEHKFKNEYINPVYIEIGMDLGGNYLCLDTGEQEFGALYFYDQELAEENEDGYEEVLFVARSFSDFINSLTVEEEIPRQELDAMAETGTYSDLVRFLGMGNDIDKRGPGPGLTLAQECARHDNVQLLEKCIFHGASKKELFRWAFYCKSRKVIDYLLTLGLDINERDSNGKTPLDRVFGSEQFLQDMRRLGAKKSNEL